MEFREYMNERHDVDKWFAVKIFIAGAFCGALLAVAWSFTALA